MLKSGMNIRAIFCICALTFFTGLASADTVPDGAKHDFMVDNPPLTTNELSIAFKGQTHVGHYRFERSEWPTLNFSETTFSDGRVKHVQGEEILSGKWMIANNQMCYTYDDVWFNRLCFDMYRVGNCYYHYLMTEGTRPVRVWTATSTLKGERPNCEPGIS